ncbi:hypothetical protein Ciccas_002473 [Cichlidogyrus casuarinus]|uniref:G-protein coupled receptors family 2 profile 2 domain-containing protein n=1 Tax=Cichlidogyrus casuarinus TaxID=1844966 RepID=A0ABD2QKB8_9PLAT
MATVTDTDLSIEEQNYKAPEKKTIAELQALDTEDESLRRYKEQLLGSAATKIDPPFPDDSRNFIAHAIRFYVNGTTSPDQEVDLKTQSFDKICVKIPEGAPFYVQLSYYVQREIISGLKYVQALYKGPLRVSKETVMIGSYSPRKEAQIWNSPPENAPTGMMSRGTYKVKSRFVDDDNQEYLTKLLEYSIRLNSTSVVEKCGIPCDRYFYSEISGKFSKIWIGFWSCLCAMSTLFTVLTFCIDPKRFQYPERPIIYISFCYAVIAATYLAGVILGDKIVCVDAAPENPDSAFIPKPLVIQGAKNEACIILFMLLYFFSMASCVWWVLLTVTWYLAASCQWAHEAIARNSQYLHFAAWALPATKTIGILAWGRVDGDPLSGVCFTGLSDPLTLKIFLITPLCLYLAIGSCFLTLGFLSLFRIRTVMKSTGNKTDSLEKLIQRIGIFSLFYIVPAVILIGCYVHEADSMEERNLRWYHREVCSKLSEDKISSMPLCKGYSSIRVITSEEPLMTFEFRGYVLSMLKYLMTLIVGVTSGIWIWTTKTLMSWKRFFSRICGCGDPVDYQLAQSQYLRGNGKSTIYPMIMGPDTFQPQNVQVWPQSGQMISPNKAAAGLAVI